MKCCNTLLSTSYIDCILDELSSFHLLRSFFQISHLCICTRTTAVPQVLRFSIEFNQVIETATLTTVGWQSERGYERDKPHITGSSRTVRFAK